MAKNEVVVEEIGEDGEVLTALSELEPPVQKRVLYLKQLLEEYGTKEKEYFKEIRKLDQKYAPIYGEIFARRAEIITGAKEAPDGEYVEVDAKTMEDSDAPKGIPRFWLTVLQNTEQIAELIEEADEDALEYLTDIRAEEFYGEDGTEEEGHEGFTLTFEFDENPYFTNKTLTKTYKLDDEEALVDTQGCKIDWKPSKNLTLKVLKKKSGKGAGKKGGKQPETKVEELESFFKFFTPIAVPQDLGAGSQLIGAAIQADFDLGVDLKEDVIPNAVSYFLGEGEDDEEDDEDDDDYDEDEDDDEDDEDDEDDDEDEDDSGDEDEDEDGEDKEDVEVSKKLIQARRKVTPKDRAGKAAQPAECKQQ